MTIDYQKLQQAHELAQEIAHKSGYKIDIIINFYYQMEPSYSYIFYSDRPVCDRKTCSDLDIMLCEIKEIWNEYYLPKFRIGHFGWILIDNEPYYLQILERIFKDNEWHYSFLTECKPEYSNRLTIPDSLIYNTELELIESQINYWNKLRNIQLYPPNENE